MITVPKSAISLNVVKPPNVLQRLHMELLESDHKLQVRLHSNFDGSDHLFAFSYSAVQKS